MECRLCQPIAQYILYKKMLHQIVFIGSSEHVLAGKDATEL